MKKVLGLDLGVSSIGWAYVEMDRDKQQGRILDAGVRIVPLNTDDATEFTKGNSVSPNKDRTQKRGMRRNIQRFKLRRARLTGILGRMGWLQPGSATQTDDPLEIYGLRARAARERLQQDELARVFLALNNKRGYLSNRKAQVDEEEEGTDYLERIRERDRELTERGITVGEKMYELLQENRWATLKRRTYSRASYKAEFDRIWETQSRFHPELDDQLKLEIGERSIFYQRPLKSQKGLVSKCTLEPQKRVAPKSSPVFQEYKIWQQLNNTMVDDGTQLPYPLTLGQKQTLFSLLNDKGKLSVTAVKKAIGFGGKDPIRFNFEAFEGNYTRSALLKAYEDAGITDRQVPQVDYTREDNDFDKQPAMQLWHLLYSSTDQASLEQKLAEKFGFTPEQAKVVARVRLVQDYGSLSVRAMRRILPHMAEGLRYDEAAVASGYRHSLHETTEEKNARQLAERLEVIQKGALRNPTVEKILNQLVHVVNAILDDPRFGRPDEIRIELARELKNNAKKRKETTARIARETKENERVAEILKKDFRLAQVSRKDIVKYKLAEECGWRSLYTGKTISPAKLFNSDEYDVDHIIPQSRLFDDSFGNKVLVESWVNREKGNNTGRDYMETKGPAELRRYQQDIEALTSMSPQKKEKLRMPLDNIPEDFIQRQLRESQYIVKHAMALTRQVCRDVTSTTGSITSFLRNEWGLAHVMQDLNRDKYEALGKVNWKELQGGKRVPIIDDWSKRDDHRHHAVDALVVACTSQSIVQRLNTLNEQFEHYRNAGEARLKFPIPWKGFREDAVHALGNILISFKGGKKVVTWNSNRIKGKKGKEPLVQRTLTPRGPLHLETVYGKIRQYEPQPTPLNKKFDRPDLIIDAALRDTVTRHFQAHGKDPVAAFGNLKKLPLMHEGKEVTEVRCWREQYVVRKPVDDKLNLDKVVDPRIKQLLQERLESFGNDKKKAFSNLENDPIWLNKEKRIDVRRVKVFHAANLISLHHNGTQPTDFVDPKNNHHAAIFKGPDGRRGLEMVPFFVAVERSRLGHPVFSPANAEGWPLEFTLQINDYFLFDIDPEEVDVFDPLNRALISKNLFRVQNVSSNASGGPDFVFRHHLETSVKRSEDFASRRITTLNKLTGSKVLVDRKGHIQHIIG